jgi:hypothetical protein
MSTIGHDDHITVKECLQTNWTFTDRWIGVWLRRKDKLPLTERIFNKHAGLKCIAMVS